MSSNDFFSMFYFSIQSDGQTRDNVCISQALGFPDPHMRRGKALNLTVSTFKAATMDADYLYTSISVCACIYAVNIYIRGFRHKNT